MNFSLFALRTQALVMKVREDIESNYERTAESTMHWAFVDLAQSSNYRLEYGPRAGYIRAEVFFSLIAEATAPCPEVRTVKEIGDAILLCCPEFRPLFECAMVILNVVPHLTNVAGTEKYPFAVRIAFGFGTAKRLNRRHEDFVSSSIDQTARLMGIRSTTTNILLHEDSVANAKPILDEYAHFTQLSDLKQVPNEIAKGMVTNIYYRELLVDHAAIQNYPNNFVPWRKRTVSI